MVVTKWYEFVGESKGSLSSLLDKEAEEATTAVVLYATSQSNRYHRRVTSSKLVYSNEPVS